MMPVTNVPLLIARSLEAQLDAREQRSLAAATGYAELAMPARSG